MMTVEQIVSVQKSNVETLFGLAGTAFEGVEKLVELNLQVAKAAISDAAQTTQAALSVKDAQELLALQASLFQPAAEKAAAYGRYVYEIASSTGAEVSRVADNYNHLHEQPTLFYALALAAYFAKSIYLYFKDGFLNIGKDIVVATTAVCWYVGIVAFNSDYAFTVTNVIIHGVPYFALIYVYARFRREATIAAGLRHPLPPSHADRVLRPGVRAGAVRSLRLVFEGAR